CFVDNVVQMNLMAALTDNQEAINRVYNVALGERTTLNQLYQWLRELLMSRNPQLKSAQPVYKDFRTGDIRHSLADISDAKKLTDYSPTHKIQDGLNESIEWYLGNL